MALNDGTNDGEMTTASGEWRELARVMREEDGAVHDETLRLVRGIVSALKKRSARRAISGVAIFGKTKRNASA